MSTFDRNFSRKEYFLSEKNRRPRVLVNRIDNAWKRLETRNYTVTVPKERHGGVLRRKLFPPSLSRKLKNACFTSFINFAPLAAKCLSPITVLFFLFPPDHSSSANKEIKGEGGETQLSINTAGHAKGCATTIFPYLVRGKLDDSCRETKYAKLLFFTLRG